jgi:hypothetical protein
LVQKASEWRSRAVSFAPGRRVGQITADGRAIVSFDLPISEAQDGIPALIRRNGAGLPPALSPVALNRVVERSS